jgi:HK97 family phage major capsid protein
MSELTAEDREKLLPQSMDDLRGRTPAELQRTFEVITAHLKDLHQGEDGELRDLDDAEQAAFDLMMQMRETILNRLEEHRKISEVFTRRPATVQRVYANLNQGLDEHAGDTRRLSTAEARDRALRILDDREATYLLDADQKEQVAKLLRRDTSIARRILVTENDAYRSAWMKMVTDPHPMLDADEQLAIRAWNEFRAIPGMQDFSSGSGGYGIPVFIDPSIILTAQGSGNPFLSIARQVTVNTTKWLGVSSAGVSWAFQTEGAVTTDNSPTLAQPEVDIHMARGFIPFSLEIAQDYPGFASEMSTLLAEGYDELLVDKFTRGSGTNEPKGILTAISAVTAQRVTVTTAGSIGSPDPYKVWQALPQRHRRNASWLMSVGVNNAIRQIGAANVFHGYTVNLPEGWADQLFNRPVYESPYMPDSTTWTTTSAGQALVGNFNNFVVARNGGMSVELVPHLFMQVTNSTGVGFPTGQRGWFAYARIGSDCVSTTSFKLLVVSTS